MRIVTSRADLVEALGLVSRAVSTRSSIQVLTGVLVEADDSGVTLTATDMEISVKAPLRGMVETNGAAVLPARILEDIAKTLSPREVVLERKAGEQQVEVRCGEAVFSLRILPAEDFPRLPLFPVEDGFTVEKAGFLATIDRVATSASRDETRPVLMGVLVQVGKNVVRMVATDSYRLSVKETPAEASVKDKMQAIVPARCLTELSRITAGVAADSIVVVPTHNQILFQTGEVLIISRLIDGQFPNHKQLIPENFESEAIVDRAEFMESLKRVSLLAPKSSPVRLQFAEGTLTISAQSQDVGAARESLPAKFEGESLEIGFNPGFLLAGAAGVQDEDLHMRFISPLRPGLLRGQADDFLYLIMPIRLGD